LVRGACIGGLVKYVPTIQGGTDYGVGFSAHDGFNRVVLIISYDKKEGGVPCERKIF
jgi:hypothetical protein